MKKIFVFVVISTALFLSSIVLGLNNNISKSLKSNLTLSKLEALAFTEFPGGSEGGGESSEAKYAKKIYDCVKVFDVDGQGYIPIFGKKMFVGKAYIQGGYRAEYKDVRIDCPVGSTHYTCKECECATFWLNKCEHLTN